MNLYKSGIAFCLWRCAATNIGDGVSAFSLGVGFVAKTRTSCTPQVGRVAASASALRSHPSNDEEAFSLPPPVSPPALTPEEAQQLSTYDNGDNGNPEMFEYFLHFPRRT